MKKLWTKWINWLFQNRKQIYRGQVYKGIKTFTLKNAIWKLLIHNSLKKLFKVIILILVNYYP